MRVQRGGGGDDGLWDGRGEEEIEEGGEWRDEEVLGEPAVRTEFGRCGEGPGVGEHGEHVDEESTAVR